MAPRRILLTGADGFVGRHLLPILEATYPGAEFFPDFFDVTDEPATTAAIAAAAPDAVIHLAAIAAPMDARRDPALAWRVNLHGTLTLARALPPGATLLFVGTADAYGASFRGGHPVTEATALAPQNTYGATKAAADLALGAMAAEGLRVIRIRPFNHTGPGQSEAFVVPAFARQVARIAAGLQQPEMQVGDLTPERDFLDVRDVCRAYALALSADLPPGTILNLASGHSRPIASILHDLLTLAAISPTITTDPARIRPADIPRAAGDPTLAQSLLGWTPQIPWEQTLSDVLTDWQQRTSPLP